MAFLFSITSIISKFCLSIKGVKPFLYAVASRLPRLLAIPANLIELFNCSISLHTLSKSSLSIDGWKDPYHGELRK
jgi:hypothetical protein